MINQVKKCKETLKPIPVSSPKDEPIIFFIRCLFDLQLKTINDFLRLELGQISNSILDVGAGNAPWKAYLSPKVKYTGLDITNADKFNMKKVSDVIYYEGGAFPFNDSQFENILCIEVIEHVLETDFFLSEINRCLKPNGKIILTVPWSARMHHMPNDYFRFTSEALRLIFLKHGFINITIKERGNDFAVVFNKIICLFLGTFYSHRKIDLFLTLPILLFLIPCGVVFFLISHLTLYLNKGPKADPLGYSIVAYKSK